MTGWKKVSPPLVQSPLPPEVRPTAPPSWVNREPPLSPASAQTFVWIRPLTVSTPPGFVSLWKLTVASRPVTWPLCRPVVEPMRNTVSPTVASWAWVICTVWPLPALTSLGAWVVASLYFTREKSLPGNLAWSTVAMGWPFWESDQSLAATPQ